MVIVSVCMITYNHQDYIVEAIESVLKQKTSFSLEIILSNDASVDNTNSVIDNFILNNLNSNIIRYYNHKTNIGMIPNLIFALKKCKGKYIALLEGDDYWTDCLKLQKQFDLLESNPNLIASHHWQKISEKENNKFIEKESPKQGYFPQPISSVAPIFCNKMRVKLRTLMFRNVINEGFFPNWYYDVAFGDVPLSFLLGKYGDFGFIDEKMAVYRYIDSGVSKSGLKELGIKKLSILHSENWIKIWDYADKHFNYIYHQEASRSVKGFYQTIVLNLPKTMSSFYKLLKYTIVIRKLSVSKTISHTIWLFFYYFKFFGYKLKKKLQRL
ncbi:glycosyl transferase family 2 [Mariniflexile fucanivorans]|uniref:Glycosyl transferase family 2 n=1 Tax=Mariniflexile fucanivorans TaxID=264023 RepID=A0A4R1RDD2_9FLAO|nr:glycosyltransferase family 2 protein [Mariniflexile fucanivorans]TCL63874.1 glycosyl transferase family 2 [Mariniflexile fucanivorans]